MNPLFKQISIRINLSTSKTRQNKIARRATHQLFNTAFCFTHLFLIMFRLFLFCTDPFLVVDLTCTTIHDRVYIQRYSVHLLNINIGMLACHNIIHIL